jgi:hypothetical protein
MPVRPINRGQRPWNKGLLIGQKKPLEPKHVWSIRVRLEIARSRRDLAIFDLAIDSKLRACDLVKLRFLRPPASRRWSLTRQQRIEADTSSSHSHSWTSALMGELAGNCNALPGFGVGRPNAANQRAGIRQRLREFERAFIVRAIAIAKRGFRLVRAKLSGGHFRQLVRRDR